MKTFALCLAVVAAGEALYSPASCAGTAPVSTLLRCQQAAYPWEPAAEEISVSLKLPQNFQLSLILSQTLHLGVRILRRSL